MSSGTTAREASTATNAQVVIVGGGIMGTSIAYQLATSGVRDVVLLEAEDLASGSSGKPLGGVRAQFSDPANIELGLRSLSAFLRFHDDFGVDIGLQQVGYLFLIRNDEDVDRYRASIDLQNSLGVDSRLISPKDAAELSPYLDPSQIVAAAWSPTDGFARPQNVVSTYASAAAGLGVQINTRCPVEGINRLNNGRVAVHTRDGRVFITSTLICAAGAWSPQIGAMVGVDLPIQPLRRQIAFTTPLQPRPLPGPFTIDFSTTAYFHGNDDGTGLLLGIADPAQTVGFDRSVTTDWHADLRKALEAFAPSLCDVELINGWAGLYEMTPDCNALIGEKDADGVRFLYAAGFSGHGFLQGPAVGEVIRDLYLGNPPVIDVSCFDVDRFAHSATRTELNII